MAKKDISKILTSGSPKQRLLLIAEDRAREAFAADPFQKEKPILTEAEYNSISDSFKSCSEIKLWNRWNRYGIDMQRAITNLQGAMLEVRMKYSNIRGYICVWDNVQHSELLVNSILHQIEPERRMEIAKKALEMAGSTMFVKSITDPEGYIDMQVDFKKDTYRDEKGNRIDKPRQTDEYSLLYLMGNVRREADIAIVKFYSWYKATEDFIQESGFKVPTFNRILETYNDLVFSHLIGWTKYVTGIETFRTEKNSRVDKLKPKFNCTPDFSKVQIDEDQYNWFKENHFTYE